MPKTSHKSSVGIVGSGPAALMAADIISREGIAVTLFEKRRSLGRKLVIAGSSGLNITFDLPTEKFILKYTGPHSFWKTLFNHFSPSDWLKFVQSLGINTFKGTSDRYFIEGMKAPPLLAAWKKRLTEQNVKFHLLQECVDYKISKTHEILLHFRDGSFESFDAVLFCLGGASWEPAGESITWPRMFSEKGLGFTPFTPSNVGFNVAWKPSLLKEAEGLPLKNIVVTTQKGSSQGDAVITCYGIEGTPIYAVGVEGEALIDLKPDLTAKEIETKLAQIKEKQSPIRKFQKKLKLCPGALALLYHETPPEILKDTEKLIKRLKAFPLKLESKQGLEWAISSAGGLQLKELNDQMMLKKYPGVFAAG
ncbi:MAG: TIGR03862 family flavoprotein, partial [Deltaproteobacteria bacterium]